MPCSNIFHFCLNNKKYSDDEGLVSGFSRGNRFLDLDALLFTLLASSEVNSTTGGNGFGRFSSPELPLTSL